MIIYPNIELQNGKCVNLFRGIMEQPDVYDIDPVEAAQNFERQGAEWLNIIDLDAVGKRENDNHQIICNIIDSVNVPVQVGGGIQTISTIDWWRERGANRVIIGNAAIKDPAFVFEALLRHPHRIVISIDVWEGMVVSDGRTRKTSYEPIIFANQFDDYDMAAFIFTDIDRDIDLPESSLSLITEMSASVNSSVIASGTVKTLDDISTLKYLPNIAGAIVGRALFSKDISLTEAINFAR